MPYIFGRPQDVVRQYFIAPPDDRDRSLGTGLVLGGVVLLALGWIIPASILSDEDGMDFSKVAFAFTFFAVGMIFGGRLIASGVAHVHRYNRQTTAKGGAPTDTEMDAWLEEDLKSLRKQAEKELNIPEESLIRDPELIIGPALPTDYGLGRDKQPRFASYEAAVLYLTESHLSVYYCVINFVAGTLELETTYQYMMSDITSVATVNDRNVNHAANSSTGQAIRMDGPIAVRYLSPADVSVRQDFRITMSSGETFSVTVGCHANGASIMNKQSRGQAHGIVNALRAMLREVKTAD
ncbi:hypothetical protein [Streptomyces sp. S.PB5]|uniref:hypothetical protein n=1 Tax=Streptomyces sp. S.PB5 TaxID=3020844 RepID=UPI0025B1215F|nr:hypothetical protein [Streptomyces sp. S.PB5]MDN3020600.1 hypothetical protein [Streptomyces sp. S.PB5]